MKRVLLVCSISIVLGASLLVIGNAQKEVTVDIKNAQGESLGTAKISPASHGVRIMLDLKNLSAGEHAIHFHPVAKCEGPAFETAGPHFNPDNKKHGLKNPMGPHDGDMNNFKVATDGTAHVTVDNPRVSLDDNVANSLFAGGGTSLVIHAKADDMKTDPSGASGDRIACGVISK